MSKCTCSYPHSNLRSGIANILKERGFLEDCTESKAESGIKNLEINLKYVNGQHAIRGISRISTPDAVPIVVIADPKDSGRVGNFHSQYTSGNHGRQDREKK